MDSGLLAAGLAGGTTSIVFLYVGLRILQREVPLRSRRANLQFGVWWMAFGSAIASTAIDRLLASAGALSADTAITTLYLDTLLVCVGLWALVAFLAYAYRGWNATLPLVVLYAGLYLVVLYFIILASPDGYSTADSTVTITYSSGFDAPYLAIPLLLLFIPEILGSALYLSLAARVRDTTARFRILLVGGGILVYLFATSFLPAIGSVSGTVHTVTGSLLGAAGAAMVFVAYFPPGVVRTRLGLSALGEEPIRSKAESASGA
jgi:hypothetical protein